MQPLDQPVGLMVVVEVRVRLAQLRLQLAHEHAEPVDAVGGAGGRRLGEPGVQLVHAHGRTGSVAARLVGRAPADHAQAMVEPGAVRQAVESVRKGFGLPLAGVEQQRRIPLAQRRERWMVRHPHAVLRIGQRERLMRLEAGEAHQPQR